MAKRLNKKIAIIGSVLFILVLGVAILGVLKLKYFRDPNQFVKDAEVELQKKEPDFKAAEKAYGRAIAYAKKDTNLKIDIYFKLVDMYMRMNDWRKASGCWNQIINFDTKNVKARHALLDYSYQIANSGVWNIWKDIETNTSVLIEKQIDTSPRIYRIKGQAMLELVKHGQKTDSEKSINEVLEIFGKVSQDEPNNVDTYQFIAEALLQKGEILAAKGVLNANENARAEASKILTKGIENNPSEPRAYINLYSNQLTEAKGDKDKIKKIETQLIQLTQKFPQSHYTYFALAQTYIRNPKEADKALAALEKAMELDKENVSYAIAAATLHYRKYLIDQNQDTFKKAIGIATQALTYPDSLDVPGPKARISLINRYSLHSFLANCYLDQANSKKTEYLELAEKEVHELNQILGTAENPYAIMWQGRVLYAKDQKNEAIKLMYDAYQKLTTGEQAQQSSDPQVAFLAYELAKAFESTPETGAVGMFYLNAYKNRMYENKPQMLLDFASSLMRIRDWKNALELIKSYEDYFGENNNSRQLRLSAYIGGNMYEQTEEALANLPESDPNILRLKNLHLNAVANKAIWDITQATPANGQPTTAQATQIQQLQAKLDLTKKESARVRDKLAISGIKTITEAEFSDMCRKYVEDKELQKASALVNSYAAIHPNSLNANIFKLVLAEPSPANIPPKRNDEIMLKAIENLTVPVDREILQASYYQAKGQNIDAITHFQKALDIAPDNAQALSSLLILTIADEDFSQAEKIVDKAAKYNADLCQGDMFKARLAYAKKDYQLALEKLNSCLAQRPVSSEAYLLRSQAYAALNKEAESIADAKKAYELNPYDSIVPRNLAYQLYNRNQKLGNAATIDQITETRNALETAIRANPKDVDLQNFYAKYISTSEPDRAIAVSQQILKMQPNVSNALWLGALAMDVGNQKTNVDPQKNPYFEIAMNAFKKAYEIDPNDIRVLNGYSECLRTIGKADEAEKLLGGNADMLWRFYAKIGKIDEAQKILSKLYEANPKDPNNIKGMLYIARAKSDEANILKYSNELVKSDKSLENQIIQVESLLEIGLSDEAKTKLDSLTEKYPNDPKLAFLNAWLAAKQGKMAESLKLANRNLELDTTNPRVWRLRGQINNGMGKFTDAISDFQKSKALSDNADVRIDLARAYARTNSVDQAIAELTIAADDQGSLIARNMLEEMYYSVGNVERIAKFYKDSIAKYPNGVYWYNHAGNFALRNKQYEAAFKYFDAAFQNSVKIDNEKPDAEAFDGKLRTLLMSKNYDQLQAEATKHLDSPLAPIAYERMAEAKADVGEKDAALQYFKRSLEKAGTDETYLIGILGLMNSVIGYDETIKWCNERIQTQPDSLAVNLALYNLHNIKQEYNKALEHIEKCINLSADDEQKSYSLRQSKTKLLMTMFTKMSDKQYLDKAIKEYESILKKQPTNVEVMNNLAYILADNNVSVGKALEYGQKAYQAAPNNASILDTYAFVLFKNEKYKEADEYINRSIQQYEQNKMNAPIEVYEHMALIKEKLGENDKALDAYKRALEFSGTDASPDVKNRITASIERLSK
ncbi:MAG: tetratricopeptide repeat protein [Phycisphaerales bacterium]